MPEYLAPGVFVEEVSFRSKSIEGVPTSTTGVAGMTHWGPVYYPGGPSTCEPRLITSFTEFERVYGGLEPLEVEGGRLPYVAHAARAFFENGGKRLYVSRVFTKAEGGGEEAGVAYRQVSVGGNATATWKARWPGKMGDVLVKVEPIRTKTVAVEDEDTHVVRAPLARDGAVVELIPEGSEPPDNLVAENLRVVTVDDGVQMLVQADTSKSPLSAGAVLQLVTLRVQVTVNAERVDTYEGLETSTLQRRYIGRILDRDDPEDQDAMVWLHWEPDSSDQFEPARLMVALQQNPNPRLDKGNDGAVIEPADLKGKEADPDHPEIKATGLPALGEVEDIAIVFAPDIGALENEDKSQLAAQHLISHADKLRYRIAILDGPRNSSMNKIREFRGKFDSKRAALYHPWIVTLDPTERPAQGAPPKPLLLPPSGFVAGIYARTDITRGVHKAPANEVVRGLTRFEANINTPRQEVLNPEGINALRFFEGRGHRVWGARTISSDPEWRYVNVRRLFIFIERSIDVGTQWAVFEPNNRRLWANIRRTVEDFLLVLWRQGALMGATPKEAFFVRCDRTTMTQNDLDFGRLICLIGLAPTKPAEFVIFRIGQWTADARA
ncbi:phage tail sheath family protein [Nitrococcus mobilis]|uniref:Phage tail sheath protein n=1 Tax=Nitrococcus mobilis Nb-231 TaxID=314278 RepID=A4BR16_9GAMM|nr:phage tail sheath subtilisin-like domain-containing protein [Nitrococcus mobilis]EAR22016.1 hypothetical protein NB231_06496 [Nitrococcus mobilis Nb-231]